MKNKHNIYELLPVILALLLLNGCMPRQADGRYPKSVYSYHPFNKYRQKKPTYNAQKSPPFYYTNKRPSYSSCTTVSKTQVTPQRKRYTTSYNPFNQIPKSQPKKEILYIDSYTNRPIYRQKPTSNLEHTSSNLWHTDSFIEQIEKLAKLQLGKEYKWGGDGPYTFDCSGFTRYVFERNGVYLPRTSSQQATVGQYITMPNLQKGDLVFFGKKNSSIINHSGIFLGKGEFIHASSSKKRVVISRLDSGYYHEHFKLARRITPPL